MRAPGQRSLISGIASMKAFAKPACSSIPVATASTFGSKTMSSGAKSSWSTSSLYARSQISTFRSTVSAWPCSSNAITITAAPSSRRRRGLREERLLAFLQRDRVRDPLALHALQAGLEHLEARAVDDDRDPRDLRLRRDQPQERRHRLDRVQQVGVHVDVEQVRAAAHLLERDLDRGAVVARLDQAPEARRAGDVRPLADHHEARVRADLERLEAAEARAPRRLPDRSRRKPLAPRRRSWRCAPASSRSSRRRR